MTTPRIVRTADTCSGKPRVEGTRWTTDIVVSCDFDRDAMLAYFPHLHPAQIDAALAYERRLHRRLGRMVWSLRVVLAARLLGTDVETIQDEGWGNARPE